MIRCNDHVGILEKSLALERVKQLTELFIEGEDAIVIAVACHDQAAISSVHLVSRHEINEELVILGGPGRDPEAARMIGSGYVRLMRIEVIQKGEKGTVGSPSAQPPPETVVARAPIAGLKADPLHAVENAEAQDIPEDPVAGDRAGQDRQRRQQVVVEMGEAPIQAGLVGAAVGVRREPGGLIAPRAQVFGKSRVAAIKREFPLGIERVGKLAGEATGVRRECPGRGRRRIVLRDAPLCPPIQVGSSFARIALEAQVVGADGVPDGQNRRCEHAKGTAVVRQPSGIREPPANPTKGRPGQQGRRRAPRRSFAPDAGSGHASRSSR
jgi:hypothetical protein